MRYTVTITKYSNNEYNGYVYDGDWPHGYAYGADPKIVGSALHTGEAFEVLQAAVERRNDPAEPVIDIYRGAGPGPDGATVGLAELIEAARVGATTPRAREMWVDAMVTLIEGWVYPWDDGYRIYPPPDVYWEEAGRWWAGLVTVAPPDDLIAALRERREEWGGCRFGATRLSWTSPAGLTPPPQRCAGPAPRARRPRPEPHRGRHCASQLPRARHYPLTWRGESKGWGGIS